MPVGESVFLDLLLGKLLKFKISQVFLSLHFKAELFQEYVSNSIFRNKITCIIEPEPLGTGGAINYVVKRSNISSNLFVINGDSMSSINLNQMANKYENSNCMAMIGLSEVKDAKRYGTVTVQNGNVVSFNEKCISGPGWVNNGYYIFKYEAFKGYEGSFSLEKDFFPKLAIKGDLCAFKVDNDHFIDMGIPEDYEKLCNMYVEIK